MPASKIQTKLAETGLCNFNRRQVITVRVGPNNMPPPFLQSLHNLVQHAFYLGIFFSAVKSRCIPQS